MDRRLTTRVRGRNWQSLQMSKCNVNVLNLSSNTKCKALERNLDSQTACLKKKNYIFMIFSEKKKHSNHSKLHIFYTDKVAQCFLSRDRRLFDSSYHRGNQNRNFEPDWNKENCRLRHYYKTRLSILHIYSI